MASELTLDYARGIIRAWGRNEIDTADAADQIIGRAERDHLQHLRSELLPDRDHLTINKRFQSDRYNTVPEGKVPLSDRDPLAVIPLLLYAHLHRKAGKHGDSDFATDLIDALRASGHVTAEMQRLTIAFADSLIHGGQLEAALAAAQDDFQVTPAPIHTRLHDDALGEDDGGFNLDSDGLPGSIITHRTAHNLATLQAGCTTDPPTVNTLARDLRTTPAIIREVLDDGPYVILPDGDDEPLDFDGE